MAPFEKVTTEFVGEGAPVRFEDWDGNQWGSDQPSVLVRFNRADAITYLVRRPGELGFGRAYVSGAMDIEGDIFALLDLERDLGGISLGLSQIADLARVVGRNTLRRPPIPPEEVRPARLGKHTLGRDRQAISHHYDVSNDFYRMVLGSSMTYSCAVFEDPGEPLAQAQSNKHELICRKLNLGQDSRLLDVGCGWGSMAIHAAMNYGARVVGITISESQAELARRRVTEAGLDDRIDIRLQDYRELDDEPYDAISSIGMFEHVGLAQLQSYFHTLRSHLKPGGRLLNHQIGRKPRPQRRIELTGPGPSALEPNGFINRYVFPDGELHEVGDIIRAMHECELEARHMESIRDHYALTLTHWVRNLEAHWEAVVAEVGEGRARVWRLYMAAVAVNFARGHLQVHQVLATNTPLAGPDSGDSGLPLRTRWAYDLSKLGGGDAFTGAAATVRWGDAQVTGTNQRVSRMATGEPILR